MRVIIIGETTAFQAGQSETGQSSDSDFGRIANVSVPFCVSVFILNY